MAYQRKSSKHIVDAQERAANLAAISSALDLGGGLTLTTFRSQITATQALLELAVRGRRLISDVRKP